MGKTEGTLPEETLRKAAAQEEVASDETEGDIPDELVGEVAIKESAAKKIHQSADGNLEDPPRGTATLEDATADGIAGHNLRDTANQGDIFTDEATSHNLRELPKEANLEVVAGNVPRKRSLGFKRKTKKVKDT